MTGDRDGSRSNPYQPNPDQCCEACVFGTGEHAKWCASHPVLTPQKLTQALQDFTAMKTVSDTGTWCPYCRSTVSGGLLPGHLWYSHGLIAKAS